MKQTYEVAKKVINWLGLSWLIVNKSMRSKRLDSIRFFNGRNRCSDVINSNRYPYDYYF